MIEVVEGKPMRVGDRELVPVVRVERVVRRRAFVGADGLAGEGVGFVRMRPIAILERQGGAGERRIPIPDRTVQLIGGLLLAALMIPLLLMVAVLVAHMRVARKD